MAGDTAFEEDPEYKAMLETARAIVEHEGPAKRAPVMQVRKTTKVRGKAQVTKHHIAGKIIRQTLPPNPVVTERLAPAAGAGEDGDSDASDKANDKSDSDSAEETRRKIRRRMDRKRKATTLPELTHRYRMDLQASLGPRATIAVPDVLRGRDFHPSLADAAAQQYTNAAWLPYSKAAQLFEQDLAIHARDAEHANLPFSDPAQFALIQEMLKRQQQPHRMSATDAENSRIDLKNIPMYTRAYEEAQLRTPRGQERPCVNADHGTCKRMFGFVLKEFQHQADLDMLAATGRRDVTPGACLVCLRDFVAYMYAHIAVGNQAPPDAYSCQPWANLVEVEGEYLFEDALMPNLALMYPFIMNKANGYRVEPDGDGFRVTQAGYGTCTQADAQRRIFRGGVSRDNRM